MRRLCLLDILQSAPHPLIHRQCSLRLNGLRNLAPPRTLEPSLNFQLLAPTTWTLTASQVTQQIHHLAQHQSKLPLEPLFTSCIALSLLAECGGTKGPQSISTHLHPAELLSDVVQSVKSASVEKYGCAPQVILKNLHITDPPIPFIGVPSLVAHSTSELLKNGVKAHVEKYGVLGLDDAPPIVVTLEVSALLLTITVADQGIGVAAPVTSFPFFSSAWKTPPPGEKVEGEDWRYSRSFGAPLFGAGVGLARTSIHASVHGGSLTLAPHPSGAAAGGGGGGGAQGCVASVTFQTQGTHTFDPHPGFFMG